MSTLKVATIQDTSGNNSSTPAQVAEGRAKAWVNFNGTGTVAIRDDFNVSSITDNGTGDYKLNFTTAMLNTNYAVVGGGGNGATFSLITPNAGTKNNDKYSHFRHRQRRLFFR
jgi:hypothetical protein